MTAARNHVVVTRYPSDVLRVVIGTVLLLLSVLVAYEVAASRLQQNVARVVNDLPHFFAGPARVLSFAAVLMVVAGVVAMVVLRRWRGLLALLLTSGWRGRSPRWRGSWVATGIRSPSCSNPSRHGAPSPTKASLPCS